jgi:TFIIF-interacting CTD phosphatase-like protein
VFISIRPRVKEVLKKLKQKFELVLFTAGNKSYAKEIIDGL